jgi:pimeloyl-ACP methyl ester carboxylesterase
LPFLTLAHSPLAGGPAEIYYRDFGSGTSGAPLVFLHGGWGYGIYPIDAQLKLASKTRVLIPDRSGYGRSSKPAAFGIDFHRRAAEETLLLLDSLHIGKTVFWGHSDGAVIAARLGLDWPERCLGLILEAFHYYAEKRVSREFFQTMAAAPENFGGRVTDVLRREHGDPYWRELLRSEGQTWLDLAAAAENGTQDLYQGRLSQLAVPAVFLHGASDPRTDPGELDEVRRQLPAAAMHIIEGAGHSPHNEPASSGKCTQVVMDVLARWRS